MMLKKLMNLTCFQATFLTSKKEAKQTSILENIKLILHQSICSGCKRFAAQSKIIGDNAKNATDFDEAKLSDKQKVIIKELLH